jgi:hypothetical protein
VTLSGIDPKSDVRFYETIHHARNELSLEDFAVDKEAPGEV